MMQSIYGYDIRQDDAGKMTKRSLGGVFRHSLLWPRPAILKR
jgi:hypothetical protein